MQEMQCAREDILIEVRFYNKNGRQKPEKTSYCRILRSKHVTL